eukprot:PITA_09517
MDNGVSSTKCRPLGTTEANWCRALDGGTGTFITGILLAKSIGVAPIQASLSLILAAQPLLRARIVDKQGQLCFDIDENVLLDIEIINQEGLQPVENIDRRAQEPWLRIVEDEMNTTFPQQKPFRVIEARLYRFPNTDSLIILKLHPAATDHLSAVGISSQFMKHLQDFVIAEENGEDLQELIDRRMRVELEKRLEMGEEVPPCVEDAIPPGKASKPFWARGLDVLGYGLSAFRHAILPLENVVDDRKSRIIIADFGESATNKMLRICESKSSDLNGLLIAASLRAVAKFKGTGSRGEHYASAILLNCRSMLEPVIPDSTSGFYQSAILKTFRATETEPLLKLAKRVTSDLNEAVKNRKHFTDMGDLNMLMVQAIGRPALTPSASMRTALVSNGRDIPCHAADKESTSYLNLRDWVSCSSINGVGPCLALYPEFRHGCLRVSFVYCSPLFSAETVHKLVDDISSMLNNLEDQL